MAEQLPYTEPSSPRHIVSYFDHEFAPELSLKQADADIAEMRLAGFTHMVLCVTEADIASPERMYHAGDIVDHARDAGLEVWADPWSVGGVFGGEGGSQFRASSAPRCFCNAEVDAMVTNWLKRVKTIGVNTVFWDEPEMHCDAHQNEELTFLTTYTKLAQDTGFENAVCMCANERKLEQIEAVANLPTVAEIATDPYFPNAFTRISEQGRLEYVKTWAERTRALGQAAGKRSHVWVQDFDIVVGQETMITEHVRTIRSVNMADIAIWGFGGCKSVPHFTKPGYVPPKKAWHYAKEALAA